MFSDIFDLLPASTDLLLFPFVFGAMSVLCFPPLLLESGPVYMQRVKASRGVLTELIVWTAEQTY